MECIRIPPNRFMKHSFDLFFQATPIRNLGEKSNQMPKCFVRLRNLSKMSVVLTSAYANDVGVFSALSAVF